MMQSDGKDSGDKPEASKPAPADTSDGAEKGGMLSSSDKPEIAETPDGMVPGTLDSRG